jgi:Transposase DDE domain
VDGQLVAIYCLCDDLLKALGHVEDRQRRMSDAEVMTAAIVAALHFGGNFERARAWLHALHYLPCVLSRSRFNRRLHAVQDPLAALFYALGACFKDLNASAVYVMDTFPVPVCDNIRIPHGRLYHDKAHRGYTASKRRYFYGVKLFLLATADGAPVEALLVPGATADVRALEAFSFALPEGSTGYADAAFTVYPIEEWLKETDGITLLPMRKRNSTRPLPGPVVYLQALRRKQVETAGSQIDRLMPRNIHAVTAAGFELKVMLFVLAYSVSFLV